MDIITIMKDLLKCKTLQEFINHRFNDDNIFRFNKKAFLDNIKYFITPEGIIYKNSIMINNVISREYNYKNFTSNDIVMVLGACEGDCLVFAKKVKHIICIEPLHHKNLVENISLNQIKNVSVLKYGLGKDKMYIEYENIKNDVQSYSLTELIEKSGFHPTILICDIQGYEHYITEDELKQFRIILMENHTLGTFKLDDMKNKLENAGFNYTVTDSSYESEIIHAKKI